MVSCLAGIANSQLGRLTSRRTSEGVRLTIASCFLTPGGVVLGADSTTTINVAGPDGQYTPHYYNHAQKIFEIGDGGTIGVVTWGLGSIGELSYRTLFAELSDSITSDPPESFIRVAERFIESYWKPYSEGFVAERARVAELEAKERDDDEAREFQDLSSGLIAGFCVAGRLPNDRSISAYEALFTPSEAKPSPKELSMGAPCFWGVPTLIRRVLFGIDENLFSEIVQNDLWAGEASDLLDLVRGHMLRHATVLPIREAIDYVHACITLTCKSLKFSHLPPMCGGPVEVAVITTDRGFRWVTHKTLGEAIG